MPKPPKPQTITVRDRLVPVETIPAQVPDRLDPDLEPQSVEVADTAELVAPKPSRNLLLPYQPEGRDMLTQPPPPPLAQQEPPPQPGITVPPPPHKQFDLPMPPALHPLLPKALKMSTTVSAAPAAHTLSGMDRVHTVMPEPAPNPNREIVISIPDKKVVLMENGKPVKEYKAMLGDAAEPTPVGTFRVIERIPWNGRVMGKAWMGFDKSSHKPYYYGIHGLGPDHDETSTSGCVGLNNADVLDLYSRVSKGDTVRVISAPLAPPPPPPAAVPTTHIQPVGGLRDLLLR